MTARQWLAVVTIAALVSSAVVLAGRSPSPAPPDHIRWCFDNVTGFALPCRYVPGEAAV